MKADPAQKTLFAELRLPLKLDPKVKVEQLVSLCPVNVGEPPPGLNDPTGLLKPEQNDLWLKPPKPYGLQKPPVP